LEKDLVLSLATTVRDALVKVVAEDASRRAHSVVPPSAGGGGSACAAAFARTTIALAGEKVEVRWTDGDTFKILSGRHAGRSARLEGVNALETFGPVHRWGGLPAAFFVELAKQSAALAATSPGPCELLARGDRYGRLLVSCPDAAETLVRFGHAMVLAVDGEPDPALLALQREAQRGGAGMWSGGVPPRVPTSLHSADEPDLGRDGAYDRVADTRTGRTAVERHARRYATCEERCVGDGAERACLVYVPYALRYRNKPDCLR
jgi:endonuclease YncB( thermonuclease family)